MEYKYKAFISYRHGGRDELAARLLHGMIEEYVIPEELRENRQKHPGKVFWDRRSIGAANDLPREITDALDDSEFLIVILSEKTLESKWCRQEIAYFREHRGQGKVLTVLLGGDPKKLMEELLPGMPEQSSLDLRGFGFLWKLREGIPKLCAPLLGYPYEKLMPSFLKRRQARILTASGIVLTVAAFIIGILLWSNWQIEGKNRELDRQNQTLLLRESELLTQEAMEALEDGDRFAAIEKSVAALPGPEQERPFYAPAEQVLFSAIKPFGDEQQNFIFRKTVLEQNTSVQDFCLNTDGSLLTTADSFNTLTCYDTVTGEVQWRTQIKENYLYKDSKVAFCALYDLILFYNRNSAAGVSQKTGEVLWRMDQNYAESDWFVLRQEDGVFAFIKRQFDDSREEYVYSLQLCSAKDGSVIHQISMDPDDGGSEEYEYFQANGRKHPPGCFTADGNYFVYTCYDKSGDIFYFLADIRKKTCSVLRIEEDEEFQSSSVYDLSAEREDGSLLSIRKLPFRNACLVERIRIPDGTLLWEQEIATDGNGCVVCNTQQTLLIGVGKELYELVWSDGEIEDKWTMDDEILDLSPLEDGDFAYLLKNGISAAVWSNDTGFHDTQYFTKEPFDLGSGSIGRLWNGGSIRLKIADSRVEGITMVDERSGGGYAVMIPQEDHSVVISRPYRIPPVMERECSVEIPEDIWLDYQNVGEELLVLFNSLSNDHTKGNRIVILDLQTMEKKADHMMDSMMMEERILFLKDGSSYLYDDYSRIILGDLKTGDSREICSRFPENYTSDGLIRERDLIFGIGNIRLSDSSDVLTAQAVASGIRLWRNGEFWKEAAYPRKLKKIHDSWYHTMLTVGANGMVLLSIKDEAENRRFFAYDVYRDKWHQIETDIPAERSIEILTGEKEPVFLVLDSEGMLHLYDIETRSLRKRFPTQVPLNFMKDIQFCVNDTCVLLFSKDNDLNIYDTAAEELVYEQKLAWESASRIVCCEDPDSGLLFLCSGRLDDNAYCLSKDRWMVLTEIPGMVLYNEPTGRLVRSETDYVDGMLELWSSPLLTTEELIAAGQAILSN